MHATPVQDDSLNFVGNVTYIVIVKPDSNIIDIIL